MLSAVSAQDTGPAKDDPRIPKDPDTIVRLQACLDRKFFGPGKVDGAIGEFTYKAVVNYNYATGGGDHYDWDRVIRAAEDAGGQDAVVDALFRAYFQAGRDIGDATTLDEIAAAAGLPGMAAMLAGDDHRDAVLAEDMAARRGGISGVPSFLMDRHLLFSGAMPAQRMAEAFRQANAILSARAAKG